jgi:hypothetical protein
VAAVVRNILRLPYEFGARIWNAIPACIRDPFIDFFIPLILRQIPFFAELGSTPEAWQQTRASIMLLVRQIFRDFDLWGAMRTAFGIVVRALRIPVDLIRQLIEKASRAWSAVLAAPIRFIRSALQAILRGMGRFVSNFLSHLWFGVQGWLFNAVSDRGITPPSSWTDFRAVFGFVLDVLGISLDHVLDLLATRIGRPAVARIRTIINVLTGVWEWVSVAIREGPAGIWRMIVERLRNLGNMVLETAVRWVMTRIMAIVGARLAAMAASAGLSAILEAVYAAYQAIQTALEYARRIIQVLITVFDTVIQIAQGVIDPAAQGVETGLRMIMPVVIGFLANYAGLGGIGQRIREIIDGVRERVDQGILWLIDRALAAGRWILDRLRAGVAAVANWWRVRKTFRRADGTEHALTVDRQGNRADIIVRSEPRRLEDLIAEAQGPQRQTLQQYFTEINEIIAAHAETEPEGAQHAQFHARIDNAADQIARALGQTGPQRPSVVSWSFASFNRARRVIADPLTSLAGNTQGVEAENAIRFREYYEALVDPACWSGQPIHGTHLLAHTLHGPVTDWNIANAPRGGNMRMRQPEGIAENLINPPSSAEIRYVVNVSYFEEDSRYQPPSVAQARTSTAPPEEKLRWLKFITAQSLDVSVQTNNPVRPVPVNPVRVNALEPYLTIADDPNAETRIERILAAITRSTRVGDLIPSRNSLATQFGMGRQMVSNILAQLARAGDLTPDGTSYRRAR